MKTTKLQLQQLIQEAFNQVLLEKKFDPRILDQMNFASQELMINHLRTKVKLPLLGQGSARAVFLLDSKRVLKVAKDELGTSQNMGEVGNSDSPIVAKVFAHSLKSEWIVSELVKPIQSETEFQALTQTNWNAFASAIASFNKRTKPNELEGSEFTRTVISALMSMKSPLVKSELLNISHWGKTPDQRVVLLDYGFTEEVKQNFYGGYGE